MPDIAFSGIASPSTFASRTRPQNPVCFCAGVRERTQVITLLGLPPDGLCFIFSGVDGLGLGPGPGPGPGPVSDSVSLCINFRRRKARAKSVFTLLFAMRLESVGG